MVNGKWLPDFIERLKASTKTKMISGPFYTYRRIHFTCGNAWFFDSL